MTKTEILTETAYANGWDFTIEGADMVITRGIVTMTLVNVDAKSDVEISGYAQLMTRHAA